VIVIVVSYKNYYELAVIGLRGTTFWDEESGHRATFWELSGSVSSWPRGLALESVLGASGSNTVEAASSTYR
jgi:hypothetical protein